MSRYPTHDRRGKRRQEWGGRGVKRMGGFDTLPVAQTIKHNGITRQPRERTAATLPLNERQELVLAEVGTELTRVSAIAKALELPQSGVASTLYALQDRGLVEHVLRKGWKRAVTP